VEPGYNAISVEATAPPGTATVHLVAAVETATQADPALGYFDDAALARIDDD
jgi:hypothetical protein